MTTDGSGPLGGVDDAAIALEKWAYDPAFIRAEYRPEDEPTMLLSRRLADAERLLERCDVEWVRGHYCAGSGGRPTPSCGCG